MPLQKFRCIEALDTPEREADPEVSLGIAFGMASMHEHSLFRGVHRYAHIEEAQAAKEEAEVARARALRRERLKT